MRKETKLRFELIETRLERQKQIILALLAHAESPGIIPPLAFSKPIFIAMREWDDPLWLAGLDDE